MPERRIVSKEAAGLIFDIQRFSLHDGPGIRTTVFCKGCPLWCDWCANPESQKGKAELLFWQDRCDCCGICLKDICPVDALSIAGDVDRKISLDRASCTLCGYCADVCPTGALQILGRSMTISEVMAEVLKDVIPYRRSGGGMTLGGGEPLSQPEFAAHLLREAKKNGVSTAVDTCGYVPWSSFELVLEYVDLILFDLKHASGGLHRRYTGVDNGRILENLIRVSKWGGNMIVRVPIIPGINDSAEEIASIGRVVSDLRPRPPIELLAYHRLGVSKYRALGGAYRLEDLQPPTEAEIGNLRENLIEMGLVVLE